MKDTVCQSCGMPLETGALCGSNQDGSKNSLYCKYCYQNGSFTDGGVSMEEMADICVKNIASDDPAMTEDKIREMMLSYLPTLSRWKDAPAD